MESLPSLAPVPSASIRLGLAPDEWNACLDAWVTLARLYTNLSVKSFAQACGKDGPMAQFLPSYARELASVSPSDTTFAGPKAGILRKLCFSLVSRIILECDAPDWTLDIDFFSCFCLIYQTNLSSLSRLLSRLWQRKQNMIEKGLTKKKEDLIKILESSNPVLAVPELTRIAPMMRASADIGVFFLTGTDLLDALASAYSKAGSVEEYKAYSGFAYLGLISLALLETPKVSVLSDCLYNLKAQADQTRGSVTLLADLVTNSRLLSKIRCNAIHNSTARLRKLLDELEAYRMPSIARPKKQIRRNSKKDKGIANEFDGELHVHRMSLVSQIQDLFPDLGAGFILRLLDEYDNNVEIATAHLLDNSLPLHLQSVNCSEPAAIFDTEQKEAIDHLVPRPTPPQTPIPERQNIFDDDELLVADTSRLHIGKKEHSDPVGVNKAAIISALAAFDSDDDERDDTYDMEDVGGTVEYANPDEELRPVSKSLQQENDMILFSAYKASPELFGRTFDIRHSQARMALKQETGMTDEAIEGWSIMLQRDAKRLKKLEAQFEDRSFDGKQPELAATAYRGSPGGREEEDSNALQQGVPMGVLRGRSRGRYLGRGSHGRVGDMVGPPGTSSNSSAQRRKEQMKKSRANHNRRDQRARKMARGGFAG